jgi:hypothetical protein
MSNAKTPFLFYLDNPAKSISDRDPQWFQPLPLTRPTVDRLQPRADLEPTITYGDYFQAAADFLGQHLGAIVENIQKDHPTGASSAMIRQTSVHLVKHGAYYHPAKVSVHTGRQVLHLVLNVAVSQAGRGLIRHETVNLIRLDRKVPRPLLPRVLARGEGAVCGKPSLAMFAAQWFDGFSEFHASADPLCTDRRIWKVWGESGDWLLTSPQVRRVFVQAAAILTCYYNPFTFESILDWHHAAGDFVVQKRKRRIDVRLITVRRYAPLLDLAAEEVDLRDTLDGLILFLLDLSLRMRLDRLDGVGRMVWAQDWVASAVWKGFLLGMQNMAVLRKLPPEFIDGVIRYAAAHDARAWEGLGHHVAARLGKLSEEKTLISEGLSGHCRRLADLARHHCPCDRIRPV